MSSRKTKLDTIGVLTIVTIVFTILKITNLISWSWWLVSSPIIVPFGLILTYLVLAGLLFMIKQLQEE
ncbi:hypothetical protein LNQ49_06425 [Flavobacterium sp. F-65]|uniref:Transmembrane Fragile-X-F protein n=1 Tax=Flavobacterium pisciphilum TaxID=2893755 RepID=A0ABS8MR45_9FLAO|nr:hypothetical protein [Flavobacterium sp. F-65]MCC9071228.1 hypothetical protein [Flavobacterium sp. F-65]